MEKGFETFEAEVLSRLTKIETKLDDYTSIKQKTEEAYNKSKVNAKDIEEINDKIKWLSRTIVATLISGIGGIIFIILKIGLKL